MAITQPPPRPSGKLAGVILLVSSALILGALALHPVAGTAPAADLMRRISALAPQDEGVHGVLLLLIFAVSFAMSVFTIRRGIDQQAVLAASIAFGAWGFALVIAALIDGFLTPAIAALYLPAKGNDLSDALGMLREGALFIQIVTKFGLVAGGTAALFWSLDLLRGPGWVRAVAVYGLIAGISTASIIAFTNNLTPQSLIGSLAPQVIWYAAAGVLLLRGDV
ncbi:MAG TPA: hypothetical protein VKT51_11515 [Candidatus Eremiobacteraceae bacterium]|nr:hypothetical protein [Candidatus Eremiobacteraceae bacterium]